MNRKIYNLLSKYLGGGVKFGLKIKSIYCVKVV